MINWDFMKSVLSREDKIEDLMVPDDFFVPVLSKEDSEWAASRVNMCLHDEHSRFRFKKQPKI